MLLRKLVSSVAQQLLCACITTDMRMHTSCCACAYQLLCKRTTAVVRPMILTISKTYPIFSNNISYIFQQKEGESLTHDSPSFI